MRGNVAIGLLISKLFDNAFFEVGKKELESNFRIFLFFGGRGESFNLLLVSSGRGRCLVESGGDESVPLKYDTSWP